MRPKTEYSRRHQGSLSEFPDCLPERWLGAVPGVYLRFSIFGLEQRAMRESPKFLAKLADFVASKHRATAATMRELLGSVASVLPPVWFAAAQATVILSVSTGALPPLQPKKALASQPRITSRTCCVFSWQ